MTVWGVGIKVAAVGAVVIGVDAGLSGMFVWDDCGDSGLVVKRRGSVHLGPHGKAGFKFKLDLMQADHIQALGSACVQDLEGISVGVHAGAAAGLLTADVSVDAKSNGLVIGTIGLGVVAGAGPWAGVQYNATDFWPLVSGHCPCEQTRAWRLLKWLNMPGAAAISLGHALWNIIQR